ncbi:MAG TPA: hypothetical protein ENN29_13310 [Candidatus Hydrogenedentes bacterium]|nr:hypothetical protein [Candidatus Hydrogenedentota bacterium]
MRVVVFFALLCVLIFAGCENVLRDAPPPEPEPVGPQTKEEVLGLVRPVIGPLRNIVALNTGGLSDFEREQIMASLRTAIVNYGDTDFGREALRELGYEVMEIAKSAASQERYKIVLTCIDAIELLSMESHLLKRLGERADVILERPVVRVRGFLDDHEKDDAYVFLELVDRQRGTVEKLEARVGDEFNNLRLVRIIGRNSAVLLEYLRMPGLFFEVEAF